MIRIINRQRKIKLDTAELKRNAKRLLELLEYADFDLGVMLCNEKTIRDYNRQNRGKDYETDVLAIPYHEDATPDTKIIAQDDDQRNLGDIIICPEYLERNPKEMVGNMQERVTRILVHATCHLLGYDHIKDDDFAIMQAKETWLLNQLK